MQDQGKLKALNDVVRRYKEEDNVELEIRFKEVSSEVFSSVYSALAGSPDHTFDKIEYSINTISENVYERGGISKPDRVKYIRHQEFSSAGEKIADRYAQKIPLIRPIHIPDYIRYSVHLSKELESKQFNSNINAEVRFKVRVSFFDKDKKWRFDLTAIRRGVIKDLGPVMLTIKKELFIPMTKENFLDKLTWGQTDSFEVEVEYVGKKEDLSVKDFDIPKTLFSLINPNYLAAASFQDEVYSVAQHIVKNPNVLPMFKTQYGLKRLLNQVIALTKNGYMEIFPPVSYYLTEKADGIRCVVSINGNRCRLLADKLYEFLDGEAFVPGEITIADSELITGKKGEQSIYLFDAMVFRDENLTEMPYDKRVYYLKEASTVIKRFLPCEPKNVIRLEEGNLKAGFKSVYEGKYPYEIDGLILTSPDGSYERTISYKWKPMEATTIDFLAILAPKTMLGIKPFIPIKGYEIYILFVGINYMEKEKLGLALLPQYKQIFPEVVIGTENSSYFPVQFSPSANPNAYVFYYPSEGPKIDRKIVELKRDEKIKLLNHWQFVRIREDRKYEPGYYGNNYRVAEMTYQNYINPLPFEELHDPKFGYFSKEKDQIFASPNGFKRYVISQLITDNLKDAKWVIDLAAGRGADLNRYVQAGVQSAIFVDIDKTALAELISRKFELIARRRADKKGHSPKELKGMSIHTLVADLNAPYQNTINSILDFNVSEGTMDGCVCNFAIHYFLNTVESARNFLKLVASMLKIGGVFIFTCMNGKEIFDLLMKSPNGEWSVREGDMIKYEVKKKFMGTALADYGQAISVKLPFTEDTYTEVLVNIDFIIREAAKLGMNVELNGSFNEYLGDFSRANKNMSEKLTEEDKLYCGMHSFVSFRKMKEVKLK
jgi:hypothetical protein